MKRIIYRLFFGHLFIGFLVLFAFSFRVKAQSNAISISSNPGPGLHITLNWDRAIGASGYNIYRKESLGDPYPTTPINAHPVQPASNCFVIRQLLLIPDSTSWKLVARALADSTPFNPCLLNTIPIDSPRYKKLRLLARKNLQIAQAMGLAYNDAAVLNGKTYYYKIVALNGANLEIGVVATDLTVTAGVFTLPPPPSGVVAEAGDGEILLRWNDVSGAAGYKILRAFKKSILPYYPVNESDFSVRLTHKLNGDTLIPATEGFLDFSRWDSAGNPIPHTVKGLSIGGPVNGVQYYYKIQAIDLFDRVGTASSIVSATPQDKTPPSVPGNITIAPDNINGTMGVRWRHVTLDVNGRLESPPVNHYELYRYENADNPDSIPGVLVYTNIPGPAKGVLGLDTTDKSPNLRKKFGDKTWYYRLRAMDAAGNKSRFSAAFQGTIQDNTPPDIVHHVATVGYEDRIELKWDLNTEPDMQGYMIYRSLCHLGKWVDCKAANDSCRQYYTGNSYEKGVKTCPCSGPFVFLGEISQDSATRAQTLSHFFYSDRSIPAGSPLCYAYWVKAKDKSGNLSGNFPIPSLQEQAEIKCERLRDKTPPEPALISGLFALDHQIKVEWVGPPTQDTRAFHVYRAQGVLPQKEPPLSEFKWVGGMTVERPPLVPMPMSKPYTPPGTAPCEFIPVQADEYMSKGYFIDTKVQPKISYWYRVVGIDYDGNEGLLGKAAPISTFTFARRLAPAPVVESIVSVKDTCGLLISWSPSYNAGEEDGFIIYKSAQPSGKYTPLGSPIKGNTFLDKEVVKGTQYWYQLSSLSKNGRVSLLSSPQSGISN